MGIIDKIQIKRVTGYKGTFSNAIKNLNDRVSLSDGEPIICSFSESDNSDLRWFLAIKTPSGHLKVFPAFTDLDDFSAFVANKLNINLADMISDQSDVDASQVDSEGKVILKMKGSVGGGNSWIEL